MALGSEVVVMLSGGVGAGATEIDSVADAVSGLGVVESVTCTVKLELPRLLGVPLMVPPVERLRPGGSDPATTLHAYGTVPPDADRVDE